MPALPCVVDRRWARADELTRTGLTGTAANRQALLEARARGA